MGRKALVTDAIYFKLTQIKQAKAKNGSTKRLTAKDALAELELMVKVGRLPKGTQLPGESAIRKALQDISEPLDSLLDKPWSIGACLKYDIPADMISQLIELQKVCSTPPEDVLTTRQARWFVRLYPAIENVIKATKPDADRDPIYHMGLHFMIAGRYAERERVSEMLGKDHPDTSELDTLYFVKQDLDINEDFISTVIPGLAESYRLFKESRLELYRHFKESRLEFSRQTGESQNERAHTEEGQ